MQLPPLITDLALIQAVAAVTTLIFKKIKQPVVLGYVIAGFFVGPHVSLGFERNGQRNLNPDSTVLLTEGDIVWIVGVRKKLNDFLRTKLRTWQVLL